MSNQVDMSKLKQLAAIMFTDMAGYTALMGKDEQLAFSLLEKNRKIHNTALKEHNGRLLKEMGDGMLVSFQSVTDAVRCAQNLQAICREQQDIKLRIGIHLGEVVFEGNDVFGNGVNIASRIESIAPVGGILVSDAVARNLENNKEIHLHFAGTHTLKNVTHPVDVYQVLTDGVAPQQKPAASKRKRLRMIGATGLIVLLAAAGWFGVSRSWGGHAAPPKAIAVLPFSNLSMEEDNAFFAAGVHEDILNKLSSLQDLRVISRNSVSKYKDYDGDMQTLSGRLGVGYVVEGSVMRWQDSVRVMVQLVDATSDINIWSGQFAGGLSNVFQLQSNISSEIVSKLGARLNTQEHTLLSSIPTNNPDAYDDFIKARMILNASWVSYERLKQAIGMLERAVEADEMFVEAGALLAQSLCDRYEWETDFDEEVSEARAVADQAQTVLNQTKNLDPNHPAVMRAEGYYYAKVAGDQVEALRFFDRALEIFPNDVETLVYQAQIYVYMGQLKKAIENMERAYAVDSENGWLIYILTFAYEMDRRYSEMVPFFERLFELEPERTHYRVQAKYYDFLAKGSVEAYRQFEEAVQSVERTDQCDLRTVQDKEMVVAMINGRFDPYFRAWSGKWDQHHASHGNWSCPMIINDEANHARLLFAYGETDLAGKIVETARNSISRPINEKSVCIFDKSVYEPKLDLMIGDSVLARKKFDELIPVVMRNQRFPRGAVEKAVLLQTADMVAPDRVYSLYKEITNHPISMVGLESVCADPWTYPNLIRTPEFQAEVREDGRFVEFLNHFGLNEGPLFTERRDMN